MKASIGDRKRWSAEEKLRSVLAGLQADRKVAEMCRREGITSAAYYPWRDRLMASAGLVFDRKSSAPSEKESAEEVELRQLNGSNLLPDVIDEVTFANGIKKRAA